ncbi:MAG TPA: carboxypeptidase regulatory-like domain-containing protein [Pyrinomonadaceae bacterium]|nr:carboxypeptidase regulatory-like domain-containing protein [Pyrinomonadaceae bacterium]
MSRRLGLQALLLVLGVGLLVSVHAQSSTSGNITGTVRDAQGAALPGVQVVITDQATKTERTITTNGDGFYNAPSLPAGLYTISVSPSGFKKNVTTNVDLHVSENKVVDVDLQVGDVNETVTVTSESAPVETRSGEVSSLVSEKQVTELPLNGRNYAQLALIVPGVSQAASFAARGTGLDSNVDMSVNGNQSNANLWTVDGVNNMDVGSNATLLVFPSIDSIAEFRVERNSFSAEYGQAQGAVINLITKGGGNDFHGAGFLFLRDDSLNAADAFLNANPAKNAQGELLHKGELKYKNFGFNFNGPIWKNRAFFFWSEEWRREKRGTALPQQTVPTAAEKVGDFSGPLTGPLPHIPGSCVTAGTPPVTTCTPFPGNKIPTNQLSPAGLAIMKVFPDPNGPSGLWVDAPTQPVNTRQDSIRGDVNITNKMNVMVRWINEYWIHGQASGNFWGDSPFPTLSSDWDQPSYSFAVKATNTLTPTMVNEFTFSRTGNDIIITTAPGSQALNDEIGSKFPTVYERTEGFGLPTLWGGGGYPALWHQAPWTNNEDLMIWKDDFSKVAGTHDLKFGVLFSHNQKNEQAGGPNSVYQICQTDDRTGNVIADTLLKDIPVGCYFEWDHTEFTQGRWRDYEFYGNDTWKIRPRLTLTLGLRYSVLTPAWSADNRISNFIPRLYNGTDPLSGLVRADALGNSGLPRALVHTYKAGLQPRVGLAWDIHGDGKTALRMGFGRYIGRSNVIEDVLRMAANAPWTQTAGYGWHDGSASLASNPVFRSLDTIPNPDALRATASSTSLGNAVSENFQPPESYQWNLTVSREIMKNTVLEASYVGNHGLHLWRRGINFNDVVPSARATLANLYRTGQATDTFVAANRRLKGLGDLTMSESTGDSSHHSMQLWLNRRFADRLAFQVAYTWGHTISNVPVTSFQTATTDPFNYDLDKGDADLDRRHTFITNMVYVLPSFSNRNKAMQYVLGDWQLNGIFTYLGGVPIDVLSGANTAGLEAQSTQRPDLVPGVPIYLNNGINYLNPAAFSLPAAGSFGSLGRGVVRMPSRKNVDFSINKNWRIKERYGVQFRTEFFNLFNRVNFVGLETADLAFINNSTDANFGKSTSGGFGRFNRDAGPREIQFGFKFTF